MTLARSAFHGVHCALVTPVDDERRVDKAAVGRLVEYLLEAGVDGLVPMGGTGEYPALSPEQRRLMVEATVEAASGRVPVTAGVLSTGLPEAVQAGRDFRSAGADALLLITPYYTTPTQEGVRHYFRTYAEAVQLPLLLYEMPARTGVSLTPETIAAMAADGSIVGMKACNTSITQFIRVMALAGDEIAVMSGEEPFFATHVAMGATGGILASANLVPRLWREIYTRASSEPLREALHSQHALDSFLQAIFAETNPGPLKLAMAMAGLDVGQAMMPLLAPSPETVARLRQVVPPTLARERALDGSGNGATRQLHVREEVAAGS